MFSSLVLETPTVLRMPDCDSSQDRLKSALTYRNLSADFDLRRMKKAAAYWLQRLGQEEYAAEVERLKADRQRCLLFDDSRSLWTYSGLRQHVVSALGGPAAVDIRPGFEYPQPRPLSWSRAPEYADRPYQERMFSSLVEARHAAVEVGTGLGKSKVIRNLVRHYGAQTLVLAPSANIAWQLHDDLRDHLGAARVGMYGDGRKDFRKLVTVGLAAALTRLRPGDPAYEALKTVQVFVGDEAHTLPAKTFAAVAFGVAAGAPLRFFFTGTHMRGDGGDLLLEGITGPVVFRMTVREGVDQGWLARPFFKLVAVDSDKRYFADDWQRMERAHLFYNSRVNAAAADIVNRCVTTLGHQVLVLVDEFEQFTRLLPLLRHQVGFAHGGVTAKNRKDVPEAHWRSDPKALVRDFNARRLPVLVGTSCISTGTDVQTAETVVYLRGGKSEIDVRQAVGRGTRKNPGQGKSCFNFVDFRVRCTAFDRATVVERHADARAAIYEDIYPESLEEVRSYATVRP